jgi:hypothetical protein
VSGNHYCSSFFIGPSLYGQGATILAQWWLDGQERADTVKTLKAEVKRLKEANRNLRAKTREQVQLNPQSTMSDGAK